MTVAPIRLLAALSFLLFTSAFTPALSAAPFQVSGNLPGVVLQPLAGARGAAFITSITHAGDDRLFLTFRDGRVKIYSGGLIETPFLDLRGLVGTEGEGGLLSIAFHPRYAENGLFFVNYTDLQLDTVIARYQVSAQDPNQADPASRRVLMEIDQPFTNHKGGQIQFGPDGYLYIGMGDGGAADDPECRAQRDDTLLGKILRIDVDRNVNSAPFYGIPPDNPYRGADSVPDEVWARGLRNPVPLLVRPRDRRPLHRRRGAEPARGDRPAARGQPGRRELRLEGDGGDALLQHPGLPRLHAPVQLRRADAADPRVPDGGEPDLLGHRRLRLPGRPDAAAPRNLPVRRLLRRGDLGRPAPDRGRLARSASSPTA